jgi:hypothetical protein
MTSGVTTIGARFKSRLVRGTKYSLLALSWRETGEIELREGRGNPYFFIPGNEDVTKGDGPTHEA